MYLVWSLKIKFKTLKKLKFEPFKPADNNAGDRWTIIKKYERRYTEVIFFFHHGEGHEIQKDVNIYMIYRVVKAFSYILYLFHFLHIFVHVNVHQTRCSKPRQISILNKYINMKP